jgi:O-antigen/teichoic acid export membrane protein
MSDETNLVPLLEDTARVGVHVAGLRIATYGVGFLASVLIARAVGPEGRGRYALPLTILTILVTISNLGLEHAQVYLAGQKVPLDGLWANASVVGLVMSVAAWIVTGVILLVRDGDAGGSPLTWLLVVLVQLPLLLQSLYWSNLLQLAGRLRAAIGATFAGALLQTAAVAALAAGDLLTPFRVLAVAGVANTATWATLLWLSGRAGLVRLRWDRRTLRAGVRFGVKAQLGIVFVFLLFRADQLIVHSVLGFEALGVYSLAVTLAELIWLLTDPFASSVLRHQVAAEQLDDVRLGYAAARMGLVIAGGAAILAWLLAPTFIRLAYGPSFVDAAGPLRLLLPGIVALAIQRPLAGVLLKRGKPGLVSAFGAVALVLNVALNLALLRRMGISAASLASTIAYLFMASAYVIATARSGPFGWRDLVPGRADLLRLRGALRLRASVGP